MNGDKELLEVTPIDPDTLSEDDVQSLVDGRVQEGHSLDYKGRNYSEDLEKTVAAMLNTEGGLIVLGVDEEQTIPTQIVGVPFGRSDLKVTLSQKILTHVSPAPSFHIGIARLRASPELLVAVIEVRQGDYPPYAYQQSQFPVRRGAHNRPATLREIEQMIGRRELRARRVNEALANFHQQPVEPLGGLAAEDARRYLRLQLDAAPANPLELQLDRSIEQVILGTISRTFGWTDARPSFVGRDVNSVDFAVPDENVGTRRWTLHADGHLCFATPIVHGALSEGAPHVFLMDVAVDLMRALAWVAQSARSLGASGSIVVQGELWANGCVLENDSRARTHRRNGQAASLDGVVLGTPRSHNGAATRRVVQLSSIATPSGAAELAAEILRVALRAQCSADIDCAALAADLLARESEPFSS